MSLDDFTTGAAALVFWHPVDDEPIDESYLPWGAVAAGSSADTRLRVFNDADGYTARAVTVTLGSPGDPDAADASGQHLVSADGQVFAASIDIGDLAPNSVSDPVWLRRVTAPDADAGAAGFTLTATAGAWVPATGGDEPAGTPGGDSYDPDTAQPPVDDPEEQM